MKKTVKMSLANIQGKLSRAEMKQIMAGSSVCACNGSDCICGSTSQCVSLTPHCMMCGGDTTCI